MWSGGSLPPDIKEVDALMKKEPFVAALCLLLSLLLLFGCAAAPASHLGS